DRANRGAVFRRRHPVADPGVAIAARRARRRFVLGAYGAAFDADADGGAALRVGAPADLVPLGDAPRSAPRLRAMVVGRGGPRLCRAELAGIRLDLVLRPVRVLAHPRSLWLGVAARAGACARASVLLRQRLRV